VEWKFAARGGLDCAECAWGNPLNPPAATSRRPGGAPSVRDARDRWLRGPPRCGPFRPTVAVLDRRAAVGRGIVVLEEPRPVVVPRGRRTGGAVDATRPQNMTVSWRCSAMSSRATLGAPASWRLGRRGTIKLSMARKRLRGGLREGRQGRRWLLYRWQPVRRAACDGRAGGAVHQSHRKPQRAQPKPILCGLTDLFYSASTRATSLTAGPITVKSSLSTAPTLP
jgi:hypothetical protein